MDNYREKVYKETKSSRIGKNQQKASFSYRRRKMQKIVKKAKTAPLNSLDLETLLNNQPNFLGIFAADELETLRIINFPVSLIVNLDIRDQPGSHWIALRMGRRRVEVFDSLGFNFRLWEKYPTHLLEFLSRYTKSYRFYVSPVLQPPNSYTCGLFCAYYIIQRSFSNFTDCVKRFTKNLNSNNQKLFIYMDKLLK